MYPALLNQSPPAPYQMQQSSQQQQSPSQPAAAPSMQPQYNMPQSYAHGGRPKRGKMVLAHMNPKELNVLDHVQGKQERCPRSNLRSYSHLEELLKNPHILHKVHQHVQSHCQGGRAYADGGHAHGQALASHGVHGDTELAMIGPHTHQVFNHLARMQGHKEGDLVNSQDGRPQYWSLGDTLGGVWNSIKGAGANAASDAWNGLKGAGSQAYDAGKQAVEGVQTFAHEHPGIVRAIGSAGQKVLPALTQQGSQMAGERYGPLAALGVQGLGALGGEGADYLANFDLPENTPAGTDQGQKIGQALGGGLNQAASAYGNMQPTSQERQPGFIGPQRGINMREVGRQGLGGALQTYGQGTPGSIGGAMNGIGTALARGDSMGRGASLGAQGAWMGSQGQSGVSDAAKNLMTRFGQAGGEGGAQSGASSMREMSHGAVQRPGMNASQYPRMNPNDFGDLYT